MTQFDTPPTEPGLIVSGELPGWPKVIGILSIVWASLVFVCGGCGATMMILMPYFGKMAEADMGKMPAVMAAPPAVIVTMLVGLVWDILLLVAGIMTVRRNPGGRNLHLVWAAVAILLGIASTYFNVQWQNAIEAYAQQNPGDKWVAQRGGAGQKVGEIVGWVLGAVLGFGWPLFLLIWFGLVKKKPEDMTGGLPPEPDLV